MDSDRLKIAHFQKPKIVSETRARIEPRMLFCCSKKVQRLSDTGSSIHYGTSELEVRYWKGLRPFVVSANIFVEDPQVCGVSDCT